jgi:hypothetical protein
MKVEWRNIEQRAQELGVLVTRVPVRDFDRLDQVRVPPLAYTVFSYLPGSESITVLLLPPMVSFSPQVPPRRYAFPSVCP